MSSEHRADTLRHRSSALLPASWLLCLLLLAAAMVASRAAQAAEPAAHTAQRLQVAEPYLELHTGPGRGYPVFFVVERRQWIAVELRHTDWWRVRAEGGQVGWVPQQQLELTLAEAGGGKTFKDLLAAEGGLGRKVELGAAWGRFKSEPVLKLWLHYRLADALGTELTFGQVQGVFSSSDFWHLSLVSQPWADQRFSPFGAVGLGRFKNLPNSSLVDAAPVDANLAHATVGLRWHLTKRFTARLDWTLHTAFVSDQRSTEYRSVTAGLAFFF